MPDYFCANCDKVFSSPREGGSVPVCDCGKAARKLLSPGEELGGCRIGKHLSGKGAVSFYLAEQTAIRRPVLLKVLDSSLPEGEALLHKFLEEARNSVKFPHPNIISVLNAGRRGPLHFCVFPDSPGKELSGILEEGKIYSPEEALSLLRGIAEALQSLWLKQKTAHGCLAPCDFLLSPDGDLFLRNFWDRPETVPELEARGEEERLAYLAPERANGAPPDESSDLYSFGAILYRMTTGKRPFQGASPEEIRQALSAKESFLARAPEQDLPRSPAFRKFLARLCAAERENRFPDWGAFFEETHLLKAALLQEEVSPRGGAEVRAGSPAAVPVPRKIPLREEGKKAEPSSPPQAPSGTAQELSRPKRNTFGIVLRLLFLLFAVLALTALGIYLPRREEIRRSNALIAEAEKAWNDDLPKFPGKYQAARSHAKEKKVSLFTGTKLKGLDKKFDLLRPELVRAAEFRERYRVAYGNFLRKVSPLGVDIQWTQESCVLRPLGGVFRISAFLREQEYLANDLAA
ncbi:MAG: protein kinase, partial [Lentisphaeria bacterium]|nr:protein kinase [Lentisphaeria bacterium]